MRLLLALPLLLALVAQSAVSPARPRARDLGITPGILEPGPLNAITDVAGVRVGQTTVIRGENVRTGVTVVLPHSGNRFREKVPARSSSAVAFGWKGGIGTSSRKLPAKLGGWTVGVLVQSNYGGILTIDGHPIGERLGQHYLKDELKDDRGSIMIVIATDAPVDARNLKRMGARSMAGLARTGAAMTNGSGVRK